MFPILTAVIVFLIVAAGVWWFGFWNGLISLVNLLLAASISSSVYHAIANRLIVNSPSYVFLVDFLTIWLIFVLSFIILRAATDTLSTYKLTFDPIVEMIGRSIMAVWVAGVFTCFSMFTLHLAPLNPDFYGRGNDQGTIPDKAWLAYIQSRSRGAFSSSRSANLFFPEDDRPQHQDDTDLDARVFDPFASYLTENDFRRIILSRNRTLRVATEPQE